MNLPAKEQELKKFLGTLPPDKAVKLAMAVERGRLAGEKGLPASLILDGLRPTLRRMSAARLPTPQRLFCEPFSDFLVDAREFKQPGRISRSSVRMLWLWLSKEAMRGNLQTYEQHITRAILSRDTRNETELTRKLQLEAAACVRAALEKASENGAARRVLAAKFGGDEALFDVEEIAMLLNNSNDLSPMRGLLPKRIETLTDQHTALIHDLYDDLLARRPELCPYVGLFVLGRLKRPWEVLRLASITSPQRNGAALITATDMGLIGDILLADMENMALDIAAVRPDNLDPDWLLDKLDRFTQMSGGLVREIGPKREGRWGQRLIKIRHLASDSMDALTARAPREIIAALPVQKIGSFGGRGPRRPDLTRDPDTARIDRAFVWAKLLTGATPYAGGADFFAAHKDAYDEVANYLRAYTESLVAELKTLDFDRRPRAQAYLQHAENLSRAILGHDETEHLKRRVSAALAR